MGLDGVKAARATRESYLSKRGRLSRMHTDFSLCVLVEKTAPTPRAQPDKEKVTTTTARHGRRSGREPPSAAAVDLPLARGASIGGGLLEGGYCVSQQKLQPTPDGKQGFGGIAAEHPGWHRPS